MHSYVCAYISICFLKLDFYSFINLKLDTLEHFSESCFSIILMAAQYTIGMS